MAREFPPIGEDTNTPAVARPRFPLVQPPSGTTEQETAPEPAEAQKAPAERTRRHPKSSRSAKASPPAQPAPPPPPAQPAAPAHIPLPPPGYTNSRKPLQLYMNGEEHWNLRYNALLGGIPMSSLAGELLLAFNADPEAWLLLIKAAEFLRVPLADLLQDGLEQAVADAREKVPGISL